MSSTTGIGSTYTSAAASTSSLNTNDISSSLDKNGFLKMLTEQMKNQDPTSGQDPNQYFQTISQMTTVEQLTNLATNSAVQLAAQDNTNAQSMLGKTVTYPGSDGLPVSGAVESVQLSTKNGPSLTVAGVAGISPDLITNIK
jgi:flagellar basal-body rod modification protein FlgD